MYNIKQFLKLKKDKAAIYRINKWCREGIIPKEIELAKAVSSVITHILIEAEGSTTQEESTQKLMGYDINQWTSWLNQLVNGELDSQAVMSSIRSRINEN